MHEHQVGKVGHGYGVIEDHREAATNPGPPQLTLAGAGQLGDPDRVELVVAIGGAVNISEAEVGLLECEDAAVDDLQAGLGAGGGDIAGALDGEVVGEGVGVAAGQAQTEGDGVVHRLAGHQGIGGATWVVARLPSLVIARGGRGGAVVVQVVAPGAVLLV